MRIDEQLKILGIKTNMTLADMARNLDKSPQAFSQKMKRGSFSLDDLEDIAMATKCLQGDVLFQMTGKMSITADTEDNQLEVVVEDENGEYKKHFIGLSDNVTYVLEDITAGDVDRYKYTLNFNPKMWLPPVGIETIE